VIREEGSLPSAFCLLPTGVIDGVASLIDKSLLVQRDASGEARVTMLETIREYGEERLRESGEEADTRDRHLDFLLHLAEEAEPELHTAEQRQWVYRLEREHENFRAALDWAAASQQLEKGLRLSGALWLLWSIRGYMSGGRAQLDRFLTLEERESGSGISGGAVAKALAAAGVLATSLGDLKAARRLHEESLRLRRSLGDKEEIALSTTFLATVVVQQGDYPAARALCEESLTLSQDAGKTLYGIFSLHYLGYMALQEGEVEVARSLYQESLALWKEMGDRHYLAYAIDGLGEIARYQGDYPAARSLYEQSLQIRRGLQDRHCTAVSLYNLGNLAADEGDYVSARVHCLESLKLRCELGEKLGKAECVEGLARIMALTPDGEKAQAEQAARLFGAMAALREGAGAPLPPAERDRQDRCIATARALLGQTAFASTWGVGRTLSLDDAVAEVSGQ
jgi:tetratricopeptide (TPR) repeat protein